MSSVRARPRWFFLITPRWLGWHAFAVVASIGMLWLGDWQFHRAESGNALSWAYTFEWPIFAVFGVVFWAKTIRDEFKPHTDPGYVPEVDLPEGASVGAAAGVSGNASAVGAGASGQVARAAQAEDEDDPELEAYNAYLARLNQQVKGHGRWHGLR
jgi:hypothetical protein